MKKIVNIAIASLLTSGILFANDGAKIAKDNGCMECHNIMGQKLAPAFMGTARKNIRWFKDDAKSNIIQSIKNGSKGKYRNFSHTEMPAYGYLKENELDSLASWILDEYTKNKKLYPNGKTNNQGKGQGGGQQ